MRSISNAFWTAVFFVASMFTHVALWATDVLIALVIGPIFGKTLADQHRKPKV
jgi:hypothetical protein